MPGNWQCQLVNVRNENDSAYTYQSRRGRVSSICGREEESEIFILID